MMLTTHNLRVGYNSPLTPAINITVNDGDYLCVVGENGSGKSTFMRTLLGLIPPISGHIDYNGIKSTQIGYMPQQTAIQKDFPASVNEIVLSGCQSAYGLYPFYKKQDKNKAVDNMKRLGIYDLKNRCYRDLSGGQQQRVLLARALCATDKMLLLDEPVTGLDPGTAKELYKLINRLNTEGVAIIMITHDLSAIKHASHVFEVGSEMIFETRADYERRYHGKTH